MVAKARLALTAVRIVPKQSGTDFIDEGKRGWALYKDVASSAGTEQVAVKVEIDIHTGPKKDIMIDWGRGDSLMLHAQIVTDGGKSIVRISDPSRKPLEVWDIRDLRPGIKQDQPLKPHYLFGRAEITKPHCYLKWEVLTIEKN